MMDVRLAQVSLFENEEAEVLRVVRDYLAYAPEKSEQKAKAKAIKVRFGRANAYPRAFAKQMKVSNSMKCFN